MLFQSRQTRSNFTPRSCLHNIVRFHIATVFEGNMKCMNMLRVARHHHIQTFVHYSLVVTHPISVPVDLYGMEEGFRKIVMDLAAGKKKLKSCIFVGTGYVIAVGKVGAVEIITEPIVRNKVSLMFFDIYAIDLVSQLVGEIEEASTVVGFCRKPNR